ncbi:MAG: hypothetical protein ACE37F_29105 [Nannocystaceae bacterium]|nr:hypothetical protein [bacterium]
MSGERTILPSPARSRRGWRAGLRGRSAWLDAAAGLGAVGLVLGAVPWSMASGFGRRWQAAVAQPHHARALLADAVWGALALGAALATAYGIARVLSAVFAGRVGLVERGGLARLGVASSTRGSAGLAALCVVAVAAVVVGLRGVIAGAARSVDASAAGIVQVWASWPQRTWAVCLVVLGLAGWVELVISHRRNRDRLAQTAAQARDDRRARGGRR